MSSIAWNSEYKEMVTGHGFSHNQLTVWRYPRWKVAQPRQMGSHNDHVVFFSMGKVANLTGHTSRSNFYPLQSISRLELGIMWNCEISCTAVSSSLIRVLLLATSPDGSTVASAAADETIRLWKVCCFVVGFILFNTSHGFYVWPVNKEKKEKKTGKSHPVSMLAQSIR